MCDLFALSATEPAGRFQLIGETDPESAFFGLLERFVQNPGDTAAWFDIFAAFAAEMRDNGPADFIIASDRSPPRRQCSWRGAIE